MGPKKADSGLQMAGPEVEEADCGSWVAGPGWKEPEDKKSGWDGFGAMLGRKPFVAFGLGLAGGG